MYAWITVAQAETELALRLQDAGMVQWTASELQAWLSESLRTWNSLTNFWRKDMNLPLAIGTSWYDLCSVAGGPRTYSLTDGDLISQIEYHLIEPQTAYPIAWNGSSQFTSADLINAIQDTRDEVLGATGCTVTRNLVNAPIQREVTLADSVIDVRRVAWFPSSGGPPVTLRQSDRASKQDYDWGYTVAPAGPPGTYMMSAEPPLSFFVDRVPNEPGNYECLFVKSGLILSTSSPTLLGIPDDWSWVIKFGALAQLFSHDGNAKDAPRQEYCSFRYEQGKALLNVSEVVLAARINDLPVPVDGVRNGDDFNASWQASRTMPRQIYTIGNLVGVKPPDAVYGCTLSVVTNALLDSTYLQVSRDNYGVVTDYAFHLAILKMGGVEFLSTIPLLQGYFRRAALYNSKLNALGDYPRSMYNTTQIEEQRNPRYSDKAPEAEV